MNVSRYQLLQKCVGKFDWCTFYQFKNAEFAFKNCLIANIRKLTSSANTHRPLVWHIEKMPQFKPGFGLHLNIWTTRDLLCTRKVKYETHDAFACHISQKHIHFKVTKPLGVFIIIYFLLHATKFSCLACILFIFLNYYNTKNFKKKEKRKIIL